MRSTIIFIFSLCVIHSAAQTIINSSTVSGTWTVSGSPYIVQVSTTVPAYQSLIISPGVVVQFMPDISLNVQGQLISAGTSGQPIIFEAYDTTGWSNSALGTGGWGGLIMGAYYDTIPDNSTLDYCIIRDVKSTASYASIALNVYRDLTISNSSVTHCNVNAYVVAFTLLNALDTVSFVNSAINDNLSTVYILYTYSFNGGCTVLSGSEIGNNRRGGALRSNNTNLVLQNTRIHHNERGALLYDGIATIRGCTIDHNMSTGVNCSNCISVIEDNLFCNNTSYHENCGLTGGGGGLYVSGNFNGGALGGRYIIRNNIFANNYLESSPGGGLYVFFAEAIISNNDFVNNSTGGSYMGSALSVWGASSGIKSKVYLKNNLFAANYPGGNIDSSRIVYVASVDEIQIENNYLPGAVHNSCYLFGSYTLLGDTLTNRFGITPGMIAPTVDNDTTTDATLANFDLSVSSLCIDAGDTAVCGATSLDFAGQNRISNWMIDIGAYEHQDLSGISDGEQNSAVIHVFPNPSHGVCQLIIPDYILTANPTLLLYDALGRCIESRDGIRTNSTEVQTTQPGIYFAVLIGENGEVLAKAIIVNQ